MRKTIALIIVFCVVLSGCATSINNTEYTTAFEFTDSTGRNIKLNYPERVGVASGSLAECWLLAGGTISAVTRDAIQERKLELPEDVVDLGSLKDPSVEAVLNANLDFVILTPSLSSHISIGETLDKANITYAYFDVETFDDYMFLMEIFTGITGRDDLYKINALDIQPQIDAVIESRDSDYTPTVLLLRASSSNVKVLDSSSLTGGMLKDLGCINIADSESALLTELNLEAIVNINPEYIFIICMGDRDEAIAQLELSLISNPIWNTLYAVQSGNCHYLEKELFHYKPNARWGESYEILDEILD